MGLFDHQDTTQKGGGEVKSDGLPEIEVMLPGGTDFILLNKNVCKRVYKDEFPKLLIILDEVAELLQPSGVKTEEGKAEDALKNEIVGHIQSITQLGRSAGIHMILATQRNDAKIIPGVIQNNSVGTNTKLPIRRPI